MVSNHEKLSSARKAGIERGEIPDWYTTGGYQLFMNKYALPGQTIRQRYYQIAEAAGNIADELYGDDGWIDKFFDLIWKGWLSPSTPVLANLGLKRGTPVSCSGQFVDDSIYGFYNSRLETAILTKHGFGSSAYMGDIRPRGSSIAPGGTASGTLPVFKGFVQDMQDVSQGSTRRGSWAGYIEIDHEDFFEIADYLLNNPDDLNVGWNISREFLDRLDAGDKDAIVRYQRMLKVRSITGKGYLYFIDKVNEQNPAAYVNNNLKVSASNLCNEISLFSDQDHTFTCVLSSLNLRNWDEWKDTNAIFDSTVFLDCVAEAFIRQAKEIKGLEKAVRFTEKSRALGLGVLGFHSYLQDHNMSFGSVYASGWNHQVFKIIQEEARRASSYMAKIAGEPEWCIGTGQRNSHLMAIAPTMSTAMICGGVSQGIEPIVANVYNQNSAAGEIPRINPSLISVMEQKGVYNQATINKLVDDNGSVQDVDWLSVEEKNVFRTAFEIDQTTILRMASTRQKFIDQGQSLNLFFSADEDPKYISQIHRQAAEDPYIKGLYYMRSQAGVKASKDCEACEG